MVTIAPKKIQYVIGSKGKPTEVLVDLKTWEGILDALEEADDIAIAREPLQNWTWPGATRKRQGLFHGKKPARNWRGRMPGSKPRAALDPNARAGLKRLPGNIRRRMIAEIDDLEKIPARRSASNSPSMVKKEKSGGCG